MTVQEFYSAVGGDYSAAKRIMMMDRMILRFLPKLAEDMSCSRLEEAWKAGDRKGMFEALHSLKGVLANLGLTSLASVASETLEPLRPGSALTISDEDLDSQVRKILKEYDRILSKIRELES